MDVLPVYHLPNLSLGENTTAHFCARSLMIMEGIILRLSLQGLGGTAVWWLAQPPSDIASVDYTYVRWEGKGTKERRPLEESGLKRL